MNAFAPAIRMNRVMIVGRRRRRWVGDNIGVGIGMGGGGGILILILMVMVMVSGFWFLC